MTPKIEKLYAALHLACVKWLAAEHRITEVAKALTQAKGAAYTAARRGVTEASQQRFEAQAGKETAFDSLVAELQRLQQMTAEEFRNEMSAAELQRRK